ncbi:MULTISPECIES: TetR/AcrR family transcriptional regulator [unclassified Streptomyces]|uniref:TetR/AcrR family transcriptional regulator n=1 Tax=unclassified Streptomyces TaxID=2593676 RepID=UPI000DD6A73D|nr:MULTISPECIES: TetR family transcriptional regulator [unclassified Streptomyces]QZZ29291.1 TetR family transcriptional regulator [Streptomyces sp. ST1015]
MSEGVRERGKARRRQAILRSAYTLFAERGFEATTIADIAEAAEVSPRTVTLYFPSKLELATSYLDEAIERLQAALHAPTGERTTLSAVERWLREELTEANTPDDLDALWDRMMERNPHLHATANSRLTMAIQEGARAYAAESGQAPDAFTPSMVSACAAAAIGEVFRHPDEENIKTAITFLKAGIATLPTK